MKEDKKNVKICSYKTYRAEFHLMQLQEVDFLELMKSAWDGSIIKKKL